MLFTITHTSFFLNTDQKQAKQYPTKQAPQQPRTWNQGTKPFHWLYRVPLHSSLWGQGRWRWCMIGLHYVTFRSGLLSTVEVATPCPWVGRTIMMHNQLVCIHGWVELTICKVPHLVCHTHISFWGRHTHFNSLDGCEPMILLSMVTMRSRWPNRWLNPLTTY